MIVDKSNGRLDEAQAWAMKTGQDAQLADRLLYLGQYACHNGQQSRCTLYRDFAPLSFEFVLEVKREGEPDDCYKRWFNGGLIYHGPHDHGGDGSAPTFSVCLTPTNGWSIHT